MLRLAVPAVATNLFATLLQMVDAGCMGRIGTAELAAASIGNAYVNMLCAPLAL